MAQAISSRGQLARWAMSHCWLYGIVALIVLGVAIAFRGYWFPIATALVTTGKLPGSPSAAKGKWRRKGPWPSRRRSRRA